MDIQISVLIVIRVVVAIVIAIVGTYSHYSRYISLDEC